MTTRATRERRTLQEDATAFYSPCWRKSKSGQKVFCFFPRTRFVPRVHHHLLCCGVLPPARTAVQVPVTLPLHAFGQGERQQPRPPQYHSCTRKKRKSCFQVTARLELSAVRRCGYMCCFGKSAHGSLNTSHRYNRLTYSRWLANKNNFTTSRRARCLICSRRCCCWCSPLGCCRKLRNMQALKLVMAFGVIWRETAPMQTSSKRCSERELCSVVPESQSGESINRENSYFPYREKWLSRCHDFRQDERELHTHSLTKKAEEARWDGRSAKIKVKLPLFPHIALW